MLSMAWHTTYFLILIPVLLHVVYGVKRVQGVLFVENGTSYTSQMAQAVLTQLKFVQREFLSNFNATFFLEKNPVRIISADHDGNYYQNTVSSLIKGNTREQRYWRLENIREELIRKLQLDAEVRLLVYPTSKRDGTVAAYLATPVGQGGYMDFDDITCVYGAGESALFADGGEAVSDNIFCEEHIPFSGEHRLLTVPRLISLNKQVCGAPELHELGHVFGLSHEGPLSDCMRLGIYKHAAPPGGICGFSPANRDKVRNTQGAWLTQTSIDDNGQKDPSTCSYIDACEPARKITEAVGQAFQDTCGRYYRIQSGCTLRQFCAYSDTCNKESIEAYINETFTDSCWNSYRTSSSCELTRL